MFSALPLPVASARISIPAWDASSFPHPAQVEQWILNQLNLSPTPALIRWAIVERCLNKFVVECHYQQA